MNILSIETSADETGISIVNTAGTFPEAKYEVLGHSIHSQIELHAQYGGIFPAMAKREHAKAITLLMQVALEEAGMLESEKSTLTQAQTEVLYELLTREPELAETLTAFFESHEKPDIDLIAVTAGPGLEPALWVGVNFAKALSQIWNIPTVAVNHMEGHVLASIYDVEEDDKLAQIEFPSLALLVSGGHTELILMKDWAEYEKIGQTRDDAVGEAFDKVARMLGLPYPGGPEIGKLAKEARQENLPVFNELPRPMMHSGDFDFSFSGIKTAVRYAIEGKGLTDTDRQAIARDFEDAVTEVILKKTKDAVDEHNIRTIIVGGGVSASSYLRQEFNRTFLETHPDVTIYFPNPGLSTDNAVMIALAGHARSNRASNPASTKFMKADGNRSLTDE